MAYYRILSLDGGGIKGILTARILQRLAEWQPGFLDQVNLISGTSTGGLLALGLAAGFSPSQAVELYRLTGERVFKDSWIDDLRDLGNLIGAEYGNQALHQVLSEQFGHRTLGELKKRVLVSAFDLDYRPPDEYQLRTWKAKFFHNFPGPGSDASETLVDVAMRTSAAPTYFPIYQGYIDGGVVANNPSVCALAQALHVSSGGHNLHDVVLLSLGTGFNPRYLDLKDHSWGLAQWAPHLVFLMLEGSAGLADYQCRQLLGEQYFRINPVLSRPVNLDSCEEIPMLLEAANSIDLTEAARFLERYF